MATLVTNRPGVFSATWNAVALGITSSDGFKLKYKQSRIAVNDTNLYGDTLVDGIYRGLTGVQMLVTLKEWNAAIQTMIWPHGAASPAAMDGVLGTVGKRISDFALPLVLTAAAGTPAAALSHGGVATANTFTAGMATLSDQNDIEMLFGAVQTDIPVLLDLLLYDDSGTKRFFKWSSV